jgi:arylsulfatase A
MVRVVSIGLLVLVPMVMPAQICVSAEDQSPNFVLILTDDQSWVGSSLVIDPDDPRTKSDYYVTPNIERLANMGMSFTQGYSPAPFCCPTRRSITVGQCPARHVYQKNQPGWVVEYRDRLSIPRMLKAANASYRTAHFGKWDARFDNVTPEQMGYDVSDGLTGNGTGGGKGSSESMIADDPKLIFDLTRRAGEFIEQEVNAGNPFYVQVSHYAVHLDILCRKSSFETAQAKAIGSKHTVPEFAAMTSDMDTGIGLLLDKIQSLGLNERTYLFFLSDNGGRFSLPGESNKTLDRNFPLRDGKGSMYEGGIRVPFVVCGPDVPAKSLSRVPVTGLDFLPTIAELAGYSEALPTNIDGGSLTTVLRGGGNGKVQRVNPFLVFHQAVARSAESALILGDYKIVRTWKEDKVELFDLSKDISEKNDLSDTMPEKRDELDLLLAKYLQDVGAETKQKISKDAQRKQFAPVQATPVR